MNEEERAQFEEMIRKVEEIYDFVQSQKNGTSPISDSQRVQNGLGFIGRTTDTTPTGALIVNTPEGPIKILRAA